MKTRCSKCKLVLCCCVLCWIHSRSVVSQPQTHTTQEMSSVQLAKSDVGGDGQRQRRVQTFFRRARVSVWRRRASTAMGSNQPDGQRRQGQAAAEAPCAPDDRAALHALQPFQLHLVCSTHSLLLSFFCVLCFTFAFHKRRTATDLASGSPVVTTFAMKFKTEARTLSLSPCVSLFFVLTLCASRREGVSHQIRGLPRDEQGR